MFGGLAEAVLLALEGHVGDGHALGRSAATIISAWAGGTTSSSRPWKHDERAGRGRRCGGSASARR